MILDRSGLGFSGWNSEVATPNPEILELIFKKI